MHRCVCKAVRIGHRLLYLLLAAYLVVVLLAMIFEDSLIYSPARFPKGNWHPAELTAEDAWFQSADGTRLHGWYVPCDKPVAVVLLCPGQGGNISYRPDRLRLLHHRVHVTLLAFDYRGYGRSEGVPTEKGILADAQRRGRGWHAALASPNRTWCFLANRWGVGWPSIWRPATVRGRWCWRIRLPVCPTLAQTSSRGCPSALSCEPVSIPRRRSPNTTVHCCKVTVTPTRPCPMLQHFVCFVRQTNPSG